MRLETTSPKTPGRSSSPSSGSASSEAAATWTDPAPAPSTPSIVTFCPPSPSKARVLRKRSMRPSPASKPFSPKASATAEARLSAVSRTTLKRLRSRASMTRPPGCASSPGCPLSAAVMVMLAPPATPASVTWSAVTCTTPPAAALSTTTRFSVSATTSTDAAVIVASAPIQALARVLSDRSVSASGTSPTSVTAAATRASSTSAPPATTEPSMEISAACETSSSSLEAVDSAPSSTLPPA